MKLHQIPARTKEGALRVIVESPRGSPVKLKYEPELGAFTVSRPLILGLVYPFDWGFVPSTEADDGDPLDAMVLWDVPNAPGVVIACRPIAVVRVEQDGEQGRERNDRLLVVPRESARGKELRGPGDVSKRVRDELERFFIIATSFTDKNAKVTGWSGARAVEKLVDTCVKRAKLSR